MNITSTSPIRVLLVDDKNFFRDILRKGLSFHPNIHTMGECCDGDEVADFLGTTLVDVILMDIVMDRMDGIAATKLVAELFPQIKIIGLSMYVDSFYERWMLESGAAFFLSKSTDLNIIVKTIEEVVNPSLS